MPGRRERQRAPSVEVTEPVDARARDHDERVSLVVYHRDGVDVVPLKPGHAVVIGRAAPSDVVIEDPSVSRQHARFEPAGLGLLVQDLGTTNGTLVRGARIEQPTLLQPNEEVILGSVTVCVQALGLQEARDLGLMSHESFVEHLDKEVTRAWAFKRSATLVMLQAPPTKAGKLSNWSSDVVRASRPVDHVGVYSLDTVELLLPEIDGQAALALVASILDRVGPDVQLRCGLAVLPDAAASAQELIEVAHRALRRAGTDTPVLAPARTRGRIDTTSPRPPVPSRSPAMLEVFELARRSAASQASVLICGETGVGKEIVARFIHDRSPRAAGSFVAINAGAIPEQLVESTFFGHERGAFTGADRRARGLFEEASGGTLLLDEIGELSTAAQASVLRALETGRVRRVGASREVEVDVRVIAATHQDLEAMCGTGSFRRDLLYRLNTFTLEIPPLRERANDIDALAEAFVREAAESMGQAPVVLDTESLCCLRAHHWPGNIRELRNVIERAVAITSEGPITPVELPSQIRQAGASTESGHCVAGGQDPEADFKTRMSRYEVRVLVEALVQTGWNQTRAARLLQMPLRTLVHKIKVHGIKKPR